MSKKATKALGNRYCQARLKAAEHNEKFASRMSAAEVIGCISEDSLKKYELGITRPPNDVVALMADAYNQPELRTWYCANECPLGRDMREIPDMPSERVLIRLFNFSTEFQSALSILSNIMDDGILDMEEAKQTPNIRETLVEMNRRITEAIVILDRAERNGNFL